MSVRSILDGTPDVDGVTLRRLGRYGPILGLVGLYAVFGLLHDRFLTVSNQLNVLQQVAVIGVLAVGVTFPILCAEIDLSIAQMMEFSGLLMAVLAVGTRFSIHLPAWAAIVAALAAAGALGAVSGIATSRFEVPSFMSTLAMLFLVDGFAQYVSDNRPVIGLPEAVTWFGGGEVFGVPSIVVVFLVLLVASQLVLTYTRFGLYVYAIGGDRAAAERMGIDVPLVRTGVLVVSAVFAGVAGLVMLGRIGIGDPTMGTSLLLPPIAAVILGGANLFGGSGNMAGTLVGVLILGVLSNGLNLLGVGPAGQLVAQGVVLMVAVLANVVAR